MRILIAEDAPVSRRLLQQCLKQWGYDVAVAHNGAEAWRLFSAEDVHFPIVITDWMMPEMDGLDFIRRIRSSSGSNYVYAILLTAKSERQDVVAGMEAGADDFLSKPFDREELRVRLRAGERIVRLEQTLAAQNQELRQRIEDVETFAHTASHDLQTPLRTFGSYAQLLLADYGEALDAEGRELCEAILEDALHMKTLLDSLQEYASLGCGAVKAVAVEAQAELARALQELKSDIDQAGAIVQAPDALPTVPYAEGRLAQVFGHLLKNALKFHRGRAPRVRLRCDDEARAYRFSVQDNGIGIAPEHVERIFDMFKRLHLRDAYPGAGVGLSIAKKIVERHGGEIGVTSTPGKGSTFWFTVPKVGEQSCGD